MQKLIQSILGIAISLLGLVVIFGWLTHNERLIQVSPDSANMQFNTALSFLLTGIAIIVARRRQILSGVFGFIVATFTLTTLLQYVFKTNTGIDELFIKSWINTFSKHPGRMAPNTAFCFVLTGITLMDINLFPNKRTSNHIAVLCSMIVGSISICAIIGYLLNIEFTYSWDDLTRMAMHTSLGFLFIAAAIVSTIKKSLIEKEWLFCITVGSLGFVFSLLSWQGLIFHQTKQIKETIKHETNYLKSAFIDDLSNYFDSINTILLLKKNDSSDAGNHIKKYGEEHQALLTFSEIDSTKKSAVLYSRLTNQKTKEVIEVCKNSISNKNNLNIVIQNRFICLKRNDSNLLAILNLDKIIDKRFNNPSLKNYAFVVYKNKELFYEKDVGEDYYYQQQWKNTTKFNLLKSYWEIDMWPKKTSLREKATYYPLIFILFGFTITLSLVLTIRLWQKSQTEAKNTQLIYDITVIASAEENIKRAMKKCLNLICKELDWEIGHIYLISEENNVSFLTSSHIWYLKHPEKSEQFKIISEKTFFEKGMNSPGRIWEIKAPIWIADVTQDNTFIRNNEFADKKIHAAMGFPVIVNKKLVAVFEFFSFEMRNPNVKILNLLKLISKELGQIFERVLSKKELEKYANDLKSTNSILDFFAKHDPLTGVANRVQFMQNLKKTLARCDRNKNKAAILAVDLDRFKNVNDTYGHDIGDLLLKETTQRMLQCIRQYDTLSRLGGDEFVVIIDSIENIKSIEIVCRKLLSEIEKEFILNNNHISITMSIGVSIYPTHGSHIMELMHNADVALYKAKNNGKNQFFIFSPD